MNNNSDSSSSSDASSVPALPSVPEPPVMPNLPAPVDDSHDPLAIHMDPPGLPPAPPTSPPAEDNHFPPAEPPQPSDSGTSVPSAPAMPAVPPVVSGSATDGLMQLKQQALQSLAPLVDHLEQTPEEKFKTTMMMLQASDNPELVKDAYAAANAITDEKAKAHALLDVVNEINYFTQHGATSTDAPAN